MRKSFLTITFFLICLNLSLNAQIKSEYEFVFHTTINTHILEEYTGQLYFNNSSSIFFWKMKGDNSIISNVENNFTRAEHLKDGEFNYLNLNQQKIISKVVISKNEKHFVEQENPDFNWEILDISETVAGYQCFKATANYMGRNYIAWFTKEIPVPYGPWKLNGLPGLILKAHDTANEISFSITEINKKDIIKQVSYKKLVDLEYYYQRMVDYPFERLKKVQSKAPKGVSISISQINYNFIEKSFEVLGKKEFKN